MHEAERGVFELRRGRPLYVAAPHGPGPQGILLATVESLSCATLDQLRQVDSGRLRLTVTGHRARAMGVTNGFERNTSIGLSGDIDVDQILRLSSAIGNYASSLLDVQEASAEELGGLTLSRLGGLLPAIVSASADAANVSELQSLLESGAVLSTTAAQIDALAADARVELVYVSDGWVPLEDAEDAWFMCFREANGLLEHVAILIGNRESWPDPVPVRLHSACLTGDLFGSLRCDCGEQLRGSLRIFAESGGGVLLYLAHEGRGIGLGNKLRAYLLQQEGLDTIDADSTLGFGADERCYDAAVEILRHLRVDRVRLLTNNPEKVRALRDAGIRVVQRQPLHGTLNRYNVQYVTAKVHRAGHWLSEMLSGAVPGK
ncbi:MAG: GTP cyclohydrolase II RibA [Acidobacteria bacterium]|nr:MAG: GTP cyclohydrolase II RibA [Acidobacteriota bacterium]